MSTVAASVSSPGFFLKDFSLQSCYYSTISSLHRWWRQRWWGQRTRGGSLVSDIKGPKQNYHSCSETLSPSIFSTIDDSLYHYYVTLTVSRSLPQKSSLSWTSVKEKSTPASPGTGVVVALATVPGKKQKIRGFHSTGHHHPSIDVYACLLSPCHEKVQRPEKLSCQDYAPTWNLPMIKNQT